MHESIRQLFETAEAEEQRRERERSWKLMLDQIPYKINRAHEPLIRSRPFPAISTNRLER